VGRGGGGNKERVGRSRKEGGISRKKGRDRRKQTSKPGAVVATVSHRWPLPVVGSNSWHH
jgi:hypothetical protein